MEAYAGANCAPKADRPSPTLERIEHLAGDAERYAYNLETFVARFRGLPQGETAPGKLQGVPAGHEGQISRLSDALSRIEILTNQLADIG